MQRITYPWWYSEQCQLRDLVHANVTFKLNFTSRVVGKFVAMQSKDIKFYTLPTFCVIGEEMFSNPIHKLEHIVHMQYINRMDSYIGWGWQSISYYDLTQGIRWFYNSWMYIPYSPITRLGRIYCSNFYIDTMQNSSLFYAKWYSMLWKWYFGNLFHKR